MSETLAICRTLAFALAVFKIAIADKPTGRFMIKEQDTGGEAAPRR